jgi:hypothetical protein
MKVLVNLVRKVLTSAISSALASALSVCAYSRSKALPKLEILSSIPKLRQHCKEGERTRSNLLVDRPKYSSSATFLPRMCCPLTESLKAARLFSKAQVCEG